MLPGMGHHQHDTLLFVKMTSPVQEVWHGPKVADHAVDSAATHEAVHRG
jgi:hypothetical protein